LSYFNRSKIKFEAQIRGDRGDLSNASAEFGDKHREFERMMIFIAY
jgi:hypothetical protein